MRERAMDDRDIDRFLNDLVADRRTDADGVDPSLADAVRELRTLAHIVGSHGAHVQIDREVTAAIRQLEMEEVSRPAVHLIVVPEWRTTRPPMPVAVPVRAVPGVTRRAR